MKKFNFITIGDSAYFHTIYYSIQNANVFYPEAYTYVYDWGFTASQQKKFKENKNVAVIPWEKRLVDISINFASWRQKLRFAYGISSLKDLLLYIKNASQILNNQTYPSFLKREMLFANKPLCMLDYLKHHGENFIFLDGDAILMQRIDELLEDSFDVGVTLREPGEISFHHDGGCSVLNVGVLFFLGGQKKNILFMNYWIHRMKETHERFIEQSALTHLLHDLGPDVFIENKETTICIQDKEIRVKVLPCREYNHYRARSYGVTKDNKIVHFKSENYKKEVFYNFLEELGVSLPPAVRSIKQQDL